MKQSVVPDARRIFYVIVLRVPLTFSAPFISLGNE